MIKASNVRDSGWGWHPRLPLDGVPVFVWPLRPIAMIRYLTSLAFMGSVVIPFTITAAVVWFYFQPALERCVELKIDWIAQMYIRNLALMLIIVGSLQLYLYTFKRQDRQRKFDSRDLGTNDRKYFANDQVWDNMLWSLGSGVSIWTVYEVLFFWASANGWVPFYADITEHPIWFVVLLLAIPFWTSMHFYWVHRLLHWKPLFRLAHAVHHRNDNLGPWSGLSMHPLEHVIFLSSALIHLVLLSHPIHLLFHMHWNTMGAGFSHSGFESLIFRGKPILSLGSFHHQLHHRYFDCNYGNPYMPWDQWFGSNHNGTPESLAALKQRRHGRYSSKLDAQR